jgi:hypothetical protein
MIPLVFILLLVSCSKFYCSESNTFLPRREISSLDEYAGIQSSGNNPPRADNLSSLPVSPTGVGNRNDPNDLVSLYQLVSIRSTASNHDSDSSDSSDGSEEDILNYYLDQILQSDIATLENGKDLILNKDGSIRKRKRINYERCAKKEKANNPESTNSYLQLINHPNGYRPIINENLDEALPND